MDAVEIPQDQVQQARPLDEAGGEFAPFFRGKDERDEIQLPRHVPLTARAGRETTHPVLAQDAAAVLDAQRKFFSAQAVQRRHERLPMRTDLARTSPQLIPSSTHSPTATAQRGWWLVPFSGDHAIKTRRPAPEWQPVFLPLPWGASPVCLHAARKSSVKGKSGLGLTTRGVIGPGVWPKRKKRASRRLSASPALTGKVVWLRPPGCADVIRAAADAAAVPGVHDVEDQRRVNTDGRMQATGRLPGAIAHAGHVFAVGAGGMERESDAADA